MIIKKHRYTKEELMDAEQKAIFKKTLPFVLLSLVVVLLIDSDFGLKSFGTSLPSQVLISISMVVQLIPFIYSQHKKGQDFTCKTSKGQ